MIKAGHLCPKVPHLGLLRISDQGLGERKITHIKWMRGLYHGSGSRYSRNFAYSLRYLDQIKPRLGSINNIRLFLPIYRTRAYEVGRVYCKWSVANSSSCNCRFSRAVAIRSSVVNRRASGNVAVLPTGVVPRLRRTRGRFTGAESVVAAAFRVPSYTDLALNDEALPARRLGV